jgi:ABC-2 type transport system ATP-binding protein
MISDHEDERQSADDSDWQRLAIESFFRDYDDKDSIYDEYGTTVAVDGISFTVNRNEIVGLLGPNGAGKTTTISMVLGVLTPTSGEIEIMGESVQRHRSRAIEHTNFAAVYSQLPGNLSLEENLRIFGMLYGVRNLQQRVDEVIQLFNLERFRKSRCGVLSSGEQTRASLAKAMLNSPELLLLDEPTASIDPATARDIRKTIVDATRASNSGVLWTSHNMYEVADVCDRVLFMSHGKVLLEGDPKTLPEIHGKATLEDLFVTVAREPLTLAQEERA